MNHSLDQQQLFEALKVGLKDYFHLSRNENQQQRGQDTFLNVSIYELEAYLAQLKKENRVNTTLNPFVYSSAIVGSFHVFTNPDDYYRQADYQLPFLFFLFRYYRQYPADVTRKPLHRLIDLFIEEHREQLSHHDIVLTATGATRCKTNVRFALDNLRQLGLILSFNEKQHRTWMPSVFGILVVLLVHYAYCREYSFPLAKGDKPGQLSRLAVNLNYDPRLIQVVKHVFEQPMMLMYFMRKKDIGSYLIGEEQRKLEHFIHQYQEVVSSNLYIDYNGSEGTPIAIKRHPRFKERIKGFFAGLIREEYFMGLHTQLLEYFQHERFDEV